MLEKSLLLQNQLFFFILINMYFMRRASALATCRMRALGQYQFFSIVNILKNQHLLTFIVTKLIEFIEFNIYQLDSCLDIGNLEISLIFLHFPVKVATFR